MAIQCYIWPRDGDDAIWLYCPSHSMAIAFAALFGLTTVAHIAQAIQYRKPFAMVLIMGGLWELGGYVARIFSIQQQKNSGIYTAQMLLILLAPLWIAAYIYMLLGRMIHFFLMPDKVFGIKARVITRIFVLFDVLAFVVQAAGGMMTSSEYPVSTQQMGLKIYTGGVGLQLGFLLFFAVLIWGFQARMREQSRHAPHDDVESASGPGYAPSSASFLGRAFSRRHTPPHLHLLRRLYAVLALIVFRNIYRLVEFAMGIDSPLIHAEWYNYVFDAVPMLIALLILNVWNPGRVLVGPNADFSAEDAERKQAKKAAKQEKKTEKRMENELKVVRRAEEKRAKKARKNQGRDYIPVENSE